MMNPSSTEGQLPEPAPRLDLSPSPSTALPGKGTRKPIRRDAWILLIIFLVNLVFVSPKLMPAFSEVNPDDEAKYVESGQELVHGQLRDLAWAPLASLVYAPVHLIVGSSPDWFMLEEWAGRFILYIFLWFSVLYLARQFKDFVSPMVMTGVLFVSVPFFSILANQSDALFVSLSVLALAFLLAFYRRGHLKDLGIASVFVGLGIMTRVETIVLIGSLTVIALVVGRRSQKAIKILMAAALPALGIMALYAGISLIMMGNVNLGVSGKSYDSFEMNQPIPAGGDVQAARDETRRLFGTQAQNQGSVLRAIARNPLAFAARFPANLKNQPNNYLYFFGKTLGPLLIFFAAWGVYALIKKRALALLIIPLLWCLHVIVALGFLALHVIPQIAYLPLTFGGIGIAFAFSAERSRAERIVLLASAVLLLVYSLAGNKPAILMESILLTAVVAVSWLLWPRIQNGEVLLAQIPLLLLLAAGLILRGAYPFPNYPALGQTIDEMGVHALEQALPPNTAVLTSFSLPALAARMDGQMTTDLTLKENSVEGIWQQLKAHHIRAVYLDSRYHPNPDLDSLVASDKGTHFKPIFTSDNNLLHVYLVQQ